MSEVKTVLSLDQLCAKYGQEIAEKVSQADKFDAKKAEVLITKALSVLQDQGLYSFVLFCESRPSRERTGAEEIKNLSKKLLRELDLINDGDFLEELRRDNGLLTKLDDLMLAIQVLEKSLIYSRFHAKAIKESQGESP